MDAMMLVEVLDVHGHMQTKLRVSGVGATCRIGRSLACDVVVNDAYAAAEHALLTLQPDGQVLVQDLGTRNGTLVEGHRIDPIAGCTISHGDMHVGRTRIHIRTPEASLPPERLFRRDLLRGHRTGFAATGMLTYFAFAAFLQWTYAPERLAPRVLIAELVALSGLALWVGAWTLISKLTVGTWQFRIHLSIAAFCMGLWAWGYWLYLLAAYVLQWNWLWLVMAGLAGCIALAAAYFSLRYATHLRRPASLLLASCAPLICSGIWWLVELQIDPRTVNRVELGARVYPSLLRVAPSTDLGDYLSDSAELKRDANRNRQESLLETPFYDADD